MLVLVGSGEYLPEVDPIDLELFKRLGEPAKVVCLPTAAGKESDRSVNSWMQKGIDHYTRLGAEVSALRVINQETAGDQAHADVINEANFVYMSGGDPGYLAQTLENTPVWEAILGVHQRGGIVAGCSAGAMIMGERIAGPGGNRPGFNLLPGAIIIPHFDEYPGIVNRVIRFFSDKSLNLVGIDGRTSLVVDGGKFEVLGRSSVSVMNGSGTQKFTQGEIPTEILQS
ncbi:MAG: Type 1 glutamine amidotransferase-like domain-containing protein [Chloroflexota bacterium]